MDLFLIFVGDNWTTTVRANKLMDAVQRVSDMHIAFGKPPADIRGYKIKDYDGP